MFLFKVKQQPIIIDETPEEKEKREKEEALTKLFGSNVSIEQTFDSLTEDRIKEKKQITSHGLHNKNIIHSIWDGIKEFLDYNGLLPDPNSIPICSNNGKSNIFIEEIDKIGNNNIFSEDPICKENSEEIFY